MTTPTKETAAVVTGIGVVAPTGVGTEEHWRSVLAGKSGIGRITRFDPSPYPVRLAGEVPGFTGKGRIPNRLLPQTDRWTHMALAAADEALEDACIDLGRLPEYEIAVVTSSSSGGTEFGQQEMERLYRNDPSWVSAYQSIAWFYAATTGQISIKNGARGPCGVVCTEQAGGLDAAAQARGLLETGSRVVLTGGTDASLCPYGVVAQMSTGMLSTAEDQGRAFVPFDEAACGYVPGEGGAILVVETAASAAERGRGGGYGTVLGHAAGFAADPGASRRVLAAVIRRALRDAGTDPGDVDAVFADAMGTAEQDRAEAQAITDVFGPGGVPVTAPKTLTGRLYGGGAPLDMATALLSMRDGVLPHTVGPSRKAAGCDIDLVLDRPRDTELRAVLVLARGHGGFTSALVLGRPEEDDAPVSRRNRDEGENR
ncbi:act minimal PKS chain-length factor (CLF/KS beta) [Spinactinospora alkalitolerans]|uniref:Act minimal PKS chain-length factor (CLF/KS beta) n=1 Tax=Spinactinospora alkalitolerans TaxID=687207 RepID=A0A852TTY1_9ACTN|nr:ketosynthase chain-length factor [Spinactinospora alkalitolerans]NYE45400.1 act minimal PKS chain-length factor (CLF/KS beta) [Spinactinospora alkalitolerans]